MKKMIVMLLVGLLVTGCGAEIAESNTSNNSEQTTESNNEISVADDTVDISSEQYVEEDEEIQNEEIEEEEYIADETSVYEGSGDSVLELDQRNHSWVLYVKGNAASRYFSVKGYDENGNDTETFINTTDPYEGITIDKSQTTSMLEISSNGDWYIEQKDISLSDEIIDNQTYNGNGDQVLLYRGNGKIADISGNKESRYFSVKTYGQSGDNTMVNTTDVYQGQTMLKYDPFLFVVTSVGEWNITIQ